MGWGDFSKADKTPAIAFKVSESIESEAMYHIYFPDKHKVYRINVARVEDGEGLGDPHNAPCLEVRVPTHNIDVPDQLSSDDEDQSSVDQNEDDSETHQFLGGTGYLNSNIKTKKSLQESVKLSQSWKTTKLDRENGNFEEKSFSIASLY